MVVPAQEARVGQHRAQERAAVVRAGRVDGLGKIGVGREFLGEEFDAHRVVAQVGRDADEFVRHLFPEGAIVGGEAARRRALGRQVRPQAAALAPGADEAGQVAELPVEERLANPRRLDHRIDGEVPQSVPREYGFQGVQQGVFSGLAAAGGGSGGWPGNHGAMLPNSNFVKPILASPGRRGAGTDLAGALRKAPPVGKAQHVVVRPQRPSGKGSKGPASLRISIAAWSSSRWPDELRTTTSFSRPSALMATSSTGYLAVAGRLAASGKFSVPTCSTFDFQVLR